MGQFRLDLNGITDGLKLGFIGMTAVKSFGILVDGGGGGVPEILSMDKLVIW